MANKNFSLVCLEGPSNDEQDARLKELHGQVASDDRGSLIKMSVHFAKGLSGLELLTGVIDCSEYDGFPSVLLGERLLKYNGLYCLISGEFIMYDESSQEQSNDVISSDVEELFTGCTSTKVVSFQRISEE